MNTQKETAKIGYRDVLTQKEYMKLLVADAVNRFGDAVDSITFSWLTYALTGSASWSAVVFGLNQIPNMVIQPLAAVWVEKLDKKKVMIITDILRGLLVTVLAITYVLDVLTPWMLAVLALAISSAESFRIPAGIGFIPRIINMDYYSFGSGLNRTVSTVMELIGTGLSGIILGVFGIPAAVGIDMLSYFISAGIISFIHPFNTQSPENARETDSETKAPVKKTSGANSLALWWADYKKSMNEGLTYIKEHPLIIKFCLLGFTANAMLVPLNAFMTPILTDVWGQGVMLISAFNVAMTAGTLIGGFLYPYIGRKIYSRTIIVSSGLILCINYAMLSVGQFFAAAPAAAYIIVALVAFFIGASVSVFSSCFSVLFIKSTDEKYLSRASGIHNAVSVSAMPVLSFLSGFLAVYIPTTIILLAGAVLGILLFIVIAVKKVKFE